MLTVTSDLSSLLGRVAERDRAAFALLYQATAAKLYGIVLRILRRRELADEVLQEVFVRIWERAGDKRCVRAVCSGPRGCSVGRSLA